MDLDRIDSGLKRIVIILGVCGVAVVLIFLTVSLTAPAKRWGTTITGIDVVFVGTGSSSLAASNGCTSCPEELPFGGSKPITLNLSVSGQPVCGPPLYSVETVTGSSDGGLLMGQVQADYYGYSYADLPMTVPFCGLGDLPEVPQVQFLVAAEDEGSASEALTVFISIAEQS
jgi:hypothetical protein